MNLDKKLSANNRGVSNVNANCSTLRDTFSVTRFDDKLYTWLRLIIYKSRYLLCKKNFKKIRFINPKKFQFQISRNFNETARTPVLLSRVFFFLDYSSRGDIVVELFLARHAIWRSNSPSTYFAVWRPTWITNLKNALSQAFSVKLRAVALTSAMTIFWRTRHDQAGATFMRA